jgi:hypothetical protein
MAELNPHVAAFVEEVQRTFLPRNSETFWNCEAAFRKLLASDFLIEVLNGELRRVASNAQGPSTWIASELVLHRGDGFGLSISVFDAAQRYIHSIPYHAMYASVGREGLACNVYQLPAGYRNEVFDPGLTLTSVGVDSTPPGDVMLLRSGTSAYAFLSDKPTPVVKFMTTAIHALEWLFTKNGLQAWQANDADLSFTQLRVAADVAGRFAHQSSLSPLKQLTHHAHHAVRWSAIQNLARLSRSEAIARLREAVNDPHPHVQRAAQKTLQKLQAK